MTRSPSQGPTRTYDDLVTQPGTGFKPTPEVDETDDDAVAHIVTKDQQMRGYIEGKPIRALCGKVWIPSRDYQGLPVCKPCVSERDRRIAGMRRMN